MEQMIYRERIPGIAIDRILREPGFTMPSKHLHDDYEIYYLVEGERYYFIDRTTYHVTGGSLVFIDRNRIHPTSQCGTGSHERILISLSQHPFGDFLSLTGEMSLSGFFSAHTGILELDQEGRPLAESLMDTLASELHGQKPGFQHMAMSALSRLLIHAQRHFSSPSHISSRLPVSTQPKHRLVDDAASYITENYSKDLSLETVAAQFYVNKCYLNRIFKEATGFTVNEYINMARVRRARELLSATSMSITEVSCLLGYDSITYFERVFHRYTQTSPMKYRKAYSAQHVDHAF